MVCPAPRQFAGATASRLSRSGRNWGAASFVGAGWPARGCAELHTLNVSPLEANVKEQFGIGRTDLPHRVWLTYKSLGPASPARQAIRSLTATPAHSRVPTKSCSARLPWIVTGPGSPALIHAPRRRLGSKLSSPQGSNRTTTKSANGPSRPLVFLPNCTQGHQPAQRLTRSRTA